MVAPRKHHYLSQAYLGGFTDEKNQVWVFDRKISRVFQSSPPAIAAEKDLYTFTDGEGVKRYEIEKTLFGLVDAPVRPIVKKLERQEDITTDELEQLALFVGYLRVRTPAGMDEIEQIYNGLLNKVSPFASKDHVERNIRTYEAETGEKVGLTADEIVDMFVNGKYELRAASGHILGAMTEMGLTLAGHLRELDWTFLMVPRDRNFVVSDAPLVIVPPKGYDPNLGGVGVRSHGSVKYVALTSTICLKMGDTGGRVARETLTAEQVRQINCWIAQNSERFIFASSEALLTRIVHAAKLEAGPQKSEVVIREIPHANDPRRSLLQVYSRPKVELTEV